jgi:hypothetical protein
MNQLGPTDVWHYFVECDDASIVSIAQIRCVTAGVETAYKQSVVHISREFAQVCRKELEAFARDSRIH